MSCYCCCASGTKIKSHEIERPLSLTHTHSLFFPCIRSSPLLSFKTEKERMSNRERKRAAEKGQGETEPKWIKLWNINCSQNLHFCAEIFRKSGKCISCCSRHVCCLSVCVCIAFESVTRKIHSLSVVEKIMKSKTERKKEKMNNWVRIGLDWAGFLFVNVKVVKL